jgi:hypothetical protein
MKADCRDDGGGRVLGKQLTKTGWLPRSDIDTPTAIVPSDPDKNPNHGRRHDPAHVPAVDPANVPAVPAS